MLKKLFSFERSIQGFAIVIVGIESKEPRAFRDICGLKNGRSGLIGFCGKSVVKNGVCGFVGNWKSGFCGFVGNWKRGFCGFWGSTSRGFIGLQLKVSKTFFNNNNELRSLYKARSTS
jgi:hypothetical protein